MINQIKNILVTGCNGQLGKEIQKLSIIFPSYNFYFTSRTTLPLENFDLVKEYFQEKQIDYCINCAAYTAVDKAEVEKDLAFLINGQSPGNLASICKDHHCHLIHISTDYVFDGRSSLPYTEDHKINPQNIYGLSKLRGEEMVLNNLPSATIIRTSWVFSSFGNNFVKTMIRLMDEKDSINVVNDQFGCPTYAADLADVIFKFIESPTSPSGIFNFSNRGITTWYDFAVEIRNNIKSSCIIQPIPTIKFPTPAKRPHYSSLDCTKIQQQFALKIPRWQNALKRCLSIIHKV